MENNTEKSRIKEAGTLYLVGTPIGNLKDMSYRALEVLESVDLIAAEDTRNTVKLLNHHNISTPLSSYHEHNKIKRSRELIDKLKAKIVNFRRYCEEMGDTCEIEIVCAGNVVTHFLEEDEFFKDESLQVKLCKNALNGLKPDYEQKNIQIVSAGIGEIIKRKSEGWIEYTID